MESENIKKAIIKYRETIPKKIILRDAKIIKTKLDKASIVIGPRKSGKTYFLYEIMKNEKNPIMLNFEDNLLTGLNIADLNEIIDYSKELFGIQNFSFFLDEIQNIDNWEKFVISLLNYHYKVFITGSNSKLLSREIATALRGKSLNYLLLPCSFKEYLEFKGIIPENNFEYTDQSYILKKEFKDFFKFGGFPELILSDSLELKNKIINNYFDSVLYKDIIDRLRIKNIKLVEITLKYLLNLFGNTFSISSYENYLKSNKISYSLEDLYNIFKSLEDVFMISFLKEYSKSYKKTEFSKSKVYVFDSAYIHFLAREAEDYGRILENLVFIELFRRNNEIENKNIFYSNSSNRECDFVISNKGKVTNAIQVCYSINEKNKEREVNGLIEAMNRFNLKEGLIITNEQEETIKIKEKKIRVIPAWKWFLT